MMLSFTFVVESEGSFGHVSCPLELEAHLDSVEFVELFLRLYSSSYIEYETVWFILSFNPYFRI